MGTTGGMSKGAMVNGRLRSIVVDIGGKGCIVGGLTMSASPFAATLVVDALSLGRSVSAHTTVGSTFMGKALTTRDPQYENVCDWSYRDIAHLPQAEQKHWRLACQEELDILKKCKVFEFVDHP